ncbi:Serine phosphatase RsbU, regulator of sigma subunit [Modestobacter italicus]|uniref:Serine phosphatase RsbU, regulator of sigma subunit n=1 Tax=Modestobacter italicus (strain DSM 44449 / CECT 9708 / BC 501) TaxID=2732864 RepID=I4EQI1_MODI5|nr:SpoIIE family protein phosphatase [Modestobacter marinus]CCH85644.1 Serine phosphatase RsbU, regulator of sigma subunit [Modestobacter marinus]
MVDHGTSGPAGPPACRSGGAGLDGRLAELVPGSPRTDLQRSVLAHDWATTPLGAEELWSPTLRTAASTVLNTRFAMLLMWGRDLVMVYNDAYAPMLGLRHPKALGQCVPDVWVDVWADIEPMIAEVFAGGVTAFEDLPLVMTRNGYPEECYFTFSYSPVVEPGGTVAGLLNTVVETTPRVLAARRMAVLQQLGSLPRSVHGSATEACAAALAVLAEARTDCPFGLVYLLGADAHTADPVAGYGIGDAADLAGTVFPAQVREAIATRSVVTTSGLATAAPGLSATGASPAGDADVDSAFVLPLTVAGQSTPVGALVLGTSPHLQLDEDYRGFLSLAAGQVAAAVTDAQAVLAERRRAAERAEYDNARAQFFTEVAVTLQRAVLGPTVLPEGFAVHYEPASGTLEVGGDWYDVVDLPDGQYGVVVGDVVGRGLPAAAVMGQLRSAGRALLLESHSPAHVLAALDRFADLVPGASCSTVFCAVVDPAAGTLRYSSAGHVPAIVVDSDGSSRFLTAAGSLPLAVLADLVRPERDVALGPGSTLLLYTDGLVERRDQDLDQGMDRAVAAVTEGRHLAPAALADLLTDQLLSDAPDDDVAFLLYRTPG